MKRRPRQLSVLIIPDDRSEPYHFRIGLRTAKILGGIGVVLALHVLVGAVFYWQYATLHRQNHVLLRDNVRLRDTNRRIYKLAAQVQELERDRERFLSLLGVKAPGSETNGTPTMVEVSPSIKNVVPVPKHSAKVPDVVQGGDRRFSFVRKRAVSSSDYAPRLPTLLPVEGFLTEDFDEEQWSPLRKHLGIDIAAKTGTVVRAAAEGTIVFANWTFDLGNLVIIDHGDGFLTFYGHNQRILKGVGGFVAKGEPIANVGSSGASSGPHLHFEIWKNGVPVDPKQYILEFQATDGLGN
jgi:murein DD-endopeptidase MepM/ murein hydrolase activator NlpD